MLSKLISLNVALPVLGALLNVLFRKRPRAAQVITSGVLMLLFASSVYMFLISLNSPEHSYSFGGWPVPFGIELRMNYYNSAFLILIVGAALCAFLYGKGLLQAEMRPSQIPIFNALFLICVFGLCGIVMTNDFFNLYVFIEVSSLATYALVSWNSSNKNALLAAFHYLVVGTVAAVFFLIGVGYLYSVSGTLNISEFMGKFQSIKHLRPVYLGVCLIALGLLIKSALFPLHAWVLKVYKETNSAVLPFLGATSHKIYAFIFAKFFYLGLFDFPITRNFLLPSGLLAIAVCSIRAICAKNLRMILAFSGLIQVGYVLILMSLEYKLSFLLIVLQLFSYSITALNLFMLSARFGEVRGGYTLARLGKMTYEEPLYVILFVINAFSLAGFPATVGFLPKFGLFIDLIHNGSWGLLGALACASFATFIYLFKAINIFIFGTAPSSPAHEVPLRPKCFVEPTIVIILTLANLLVGFASLGFLKALL